MTPEEIRRFFYPNLSGQVPLDTPAPPEFGRERPKSWAVDAIKGMLSLPERAVGAAVDYTNTGTYNPGPVLEAATLPLGTGAIAGVPAGGKNIGAGILREYKPTAMIGGPSKEPRLTQGYHATTVPEEFTKFKPPVEDAGTHFSIDPNVSMYFGMWDRTVPESWGQLQMVPGSRTMPVVANINKAAEFPDSIRNWNNAEYIAQTMEAVGRDYPLKKEIEKAIGLPGNVGENFMNVFRDRGYDALRYRMEPTKLPFPIKDSFMVFDPEKVMPQFSEQAQELVKKRGIVPPHPVSLNWNPIDYIASSFPQDVTPGILSKAARQDPEFKAFMDRYGGTTPQGIEKVLRDNPHMNPNIREAAKREYKADPNYYEGLYNDLIHREVLAAPDYIPHEFKPSSHFGKNFNSEMARKIAKEEDLSLYPDDLAAEVRRVAKGGTPNTAHPYLDVSLANIDVKEARRILKHGQGLLSKEAMERLNLLIRGNKGFKDPFVE